MAGLQFSNVAGALNGENNAAYFIQKALGQGYGVSAVTGTIAAELAANSALFVARLDPSSALKAYIQRIRLEFTTLVAFSTPVTAGRRLALFRGSGAAASSGTAITLANAQKSTGYNDSEFSTAQGGDMRIASTGALTVTGITFETDPHRTMTLSHVGAAGAFMERVWEFHESENEPLILQPGQLFAIRNPVAMDAGGTWQLGLNVDWAEAL